MPIYSIFQYMSMLLSFRFCFLFLSRSLSWDAVSFVRSSWFLFRAVRIQVRGKKEGKFNVILNKQNQNEMTLSILYPREFVFFLFCCCCSTVADESDVAKVVYLLFFFIARWRRRRINWIHRTKSLLNQKRMRASKYCYSFFWWK